MIFNFKEEKYFQRKLLNENSVWCLLLLWFLHHIYQSSCSYENKLVSVFKNIQLNKILMNFYLNLNDFTEGIQMIWIQLFKSHEMISTQKII